ncbi:hypothetical protein [Microbulbifer sp. JMSA002]|uniref:hypothetical protein n=1 Tax=Microbulbifer sp. JMSA002 TaxID=3243368 RepID=UPI004039A2C3
MAFPIDQNVSNPLQVNNAGDARALGLKLFSGEVLSAWHANNIALKLTRKRTIKSGKSAQFPLFGRGNASYHTPGKLIEASKIPTVERTVTIDDVAISPVFISDIDEKILHFETRSEYSMECGSQLGELVDRNVFRMVTKAGLITDQTSMTNAGLTPIAGQEYTQPIQLSGASDHLDGTKIYAAIVKAVTEFRKKNIKEKPVVVLPPDQYAALLTVPSVANAVWLNRDVGGAGSVTEGIVPKVGGAPIYESNHVPSTNESSGISDPEPLADVAVGSGNEAKYRGDYSNVVGLVFSRSAVATTELWGINTKVVAEPLRLGHTILATQALGHDMLRPECSIPLLKA